jgi:predicted ATPase
MIHLRELHLRHPEGDSDVFPWNVPAIHSMTKLAFQTPVTVMVGENGSGKSTMLEAIA